MNSHLLYAIEVYANTTANRLSKLIVLNNKLLRILLYKSIKCHSIDLYIAYSTHPIQLLHNYQILIFIHKYVYNKDNNYIRFFLIILRKTVYFIVTLHDKKITFTLTRSCLILVKSQLNIKVLNYGMLYLQMLKIQSLVATDFQMRIKTIYAAFWDII